MRGRKPSNGKQTQGLGAAHVVEQVVLVLGAPLLALPVGLDEVQERGDQGVPEGVGARRGGLTHSRDRIACAGETDLATYHIHD